MLLDDSFYLSILWVCHSNLVAYRVSAMKTDDSLWGWYESLSTISFADCHLFTLAAFNILCFCHWFLTVFFTVQLSHPYMTTGKTIALTRWTFAGKVISLFFNMLSRLVITFFPKSKCLLISWLQSPSTVILECKKISLSLFPLFPHLFPMKW